MFIDVENKEKYFIQPYVSGLRCIIRIFNNDVKANDESGKRVKILPRIKKQLLKSYLSSNYNGYEIYLLSILRTNAINKTELILYDILLKNEFEKKSQSNRYSIRYENLIVRFLDKDASDVKIIPSYQYSDRSIKLIIENFIKKDKVEKIVFRKNVVYTYDETDSMFVEDLWTPGSGEILAFEEGYIIKREFDETTNSIKSEEKIPCVDTILINYNNNAIKALTTSLTDLDKVKLLNELEFYKKCEFKTYNFLNNSENIFVKLI